MCGTLATSAPELLKAGMVEGRCTGSRTGGGRVGVRVVLSHPAGGFPPLAQETVDDGGADLEANTVLEC